MKTSFTIQNQQYFKKFCMYNKGYQKSTMSLFHRDEKFSCRISIFKHLKKLSTPF